MPVIRVHAFGGPDVLQLEDGPVLEPAAGQVRVRVHAAGVNPVDAYIRTGTYPRKPPLPYTPGSDGAGVIDALGPGVDAFGLGDRIFVAAFNGFCTGTYASALVADSSVVHRLPDHLSFRQGAAVGVPGVTAWRALFGKGGLQPADTVLIHGASGGVGTAAVQLAVAAGATVIASAGTPAGRELVKGQGAHHVVDHGDPHYRDEIGALTGGHGPDLIVEMLANVNLAHDLAMLAMFGRVVIVGNRGSLDFNPRSIMAKDATVTGLTLPNMTAREARVVLAGVGAALRSRVLVPVVGNELPLAQAAQAHEAVLKSGAHGKIVLVP